METEYINERIQMSQQDNLDDLINERFKKMADEKKTDSENPTRAGSLMDSFNNGFELGGKAARGEFVEMLVKAMMAEQEIKTVLNMILDDDYE